MSVARPRPSEPDLWDRYARLPAGPKLVLHLKSLVFPPTTKTTFLECLTRGGLRAPDGKAWSSRTLNLALDDLLRQGLLTDELACPLPLLHPVAVDAVASPQGEALVTAVRNAFPAQRSLYHGYGSPQPDADALRRLIRLAVYANDEAGLTANCDLYEKHFAPHRAAHLLGPLFAGVPLAPEWLAGRRVPIQLALFDAKLSAFLETGVPGPDLPALIVCYRALQDRPGFAPVRPMLLHYDLLAGRLDEVRRGIAGIEDPAGIAQERLQGALAFLEGRNDAALQHYWDALKRLRKQAGKRKLFLEGAYGLLFLMALLRANDASLHAEAQAGIDAAMSGPSPHAGGFLALQVLLWLAQGLQAKARELVVQLRAAMPPEPFSAACVALAENAVDEDLARAHRADLAARFEALRDTLPLLARIHAEILAEVAEKTRSYEAFLAMTGAAVAFTQLIQVRQPWERALESLDAFLASGMVKPDGAQAPRKTKRLAWFIDPRTRQIEVAEQVAKGKDGWSDGRPVALKRLHERDPRLDYLTEQDRLALRSIRKETAGWYGEESYHFDRLRQDSRQRV